MMEASIYDDFDNLFVGKRLVGDLSFYYSFKLDHEWTDRVENLTIDCLHEHPELVNVFEYFPNLRCLNIFKQTYLHHVSPEFAQQLEAVHVVANKEDITSVINNFKHVKWMTIWTNHELTIPACTFPNLCTFSYIGNLNCHLGVFPKLVKFNNNWGQTRSTIHRSSIFYMVANDLISSDILRMVYDFLT